MLTRFLRGNTEENNRLVLQEGMISINTDDYSLRIHDGVTPGGFEVKTKSLFDWGPGGKVIIGGDYNSGFLGEVSDEELISGDQLALEVGLSAGVPVNQGAGWLKFIHRGKILYIAKKPLRHSISWDQLYSSGLVYGVEGPGPSTGTNGIEVDQNVVVPVGADSAVKVRLLTGGNANPSDSAGGEWNELLYPISDGDPDRRGWAAYTNSELGFLSSAHQWAQEDRDTTASQAVVRGGGGVTFYIYLSKTSGDYQRLWRPVLELVSKDNYTFPVAISDLEVGGTMGLPYVEGLPEFINTLTAPARTTLTWEISQLKQLIFKDFEFIEE